MPLCVPEGAGVGNAPRRQTVPGCLRLRMIARPGVSPGRHLVSLRRRGRPFGDSPRGQRQGTSKAEGRPNPRAMPVPGLHLLGRSRCRVATAPRFDTLRPEAPGLLNRQWGLPFLSTPCRRHIRFGQNRSLTTAEWTADDGCRPRYHGCLPRARFLVSPQRVEDHLDARAVLLMRRDGDDGPIRGGGPGDASEAAHSMSGCNRRRPTAQEGRSRNADSRRRCKSQTTCGD